MTDKKLLLIGAGAAAVLALVGYLAARKAGQLVADNINLVNPLSTENLVYRGANAVLDVFTGGSGATVGTAIYDAVHDSLDPTVFSQADLERITAARNHYGRDTGGWFVG